jgi:ATPase subunit of ABC transporter with duplicated ATPase domains
MANAYDDPKQAKRAKVMQKRIDQMEKVEAPDRGDRRFRAKLTGGSRHGRIALTVTDFSFAYGDRELFRDTDLEIEYGDRVCLVGPNGSGKTTFFRQVLDHGGWENETLRLGKAAKVGEYRQLHDALDHDASLLDFMMRTTGLTRTPAAELLHRFLFTREDLSRAIGTLSGGEKSRVQLARLVHDQVNFLLLDEPTNHLDIEACEVLEEMLEEFEGTLLVISHDRYFLDRLVNRVVEVRDRKLHYYRLGFADWWAREFVPRGDMRKGALEDRGPGPADKAQARQEYQDRKAEQREERMRLSRIRKLEERIAALEAREKELAVLVEEGYARGDDLEATDALAAEYEEVREELPQLIDEWESIADG